MTLAVTDCEAGWIGSYHRLTYADHVDEGYSLQRVGEKAVHPMPLGAIVATANLVDVVPMVGPLGEDDPIPHVLEIGGFGSPASLALFHEGDPFAIGLDDQRPYGDFAPGRYAWLLEDIKPTTERCPACWGRTYFDEGPFWRPCFTCRTDGRYGEGRCPPIPAKGKQGLWTWQP